MEKNDLSMVFIDLLIIFLLIGATRHYFNEKSNNSESVIIKTDTVFVADKRESEVLMAKADITALYDSCLIDTVKYEKLEKEFFAFGYKPYDYKPVSYTQKELYLLTNILYRESTSSKNVHDEIDQYFVIICAINRLYINNKQRNESHVHTVMDIIYRTKSFTEPKRKFTTSFDNPHWVKCLNITKNVLDAKIPSYIPHIPKGTIAYWNSRIDTNMRQKAHLQQRYVCVASTVKDHHYFAVVDWLSDEEKQLMKTTKNPVKKNISNGQFYTK